MTDQICKLRSTSKGGDVLEYRGNLFHLHSRYKETQYWNCVKRKTTNCEKKVYLKNGVFYRETGIHNHAPETEKISRISFIEQVKARISNDVPVPLAYREAVAEVITSSDGASPSRVQSYDSLRTSLYKYKERNKMQKKGIKSYLAASVQNNKDPNPLPPGNEVSTPDVEMQCSVSTDLETQGVASASFMSNTDEQTNEGSISIPDEKEIITPDVEMQTTEMKTQNYPSTGFLNSSDIVLKQEIIETELDPCTLDDSPFHSSIASSSGMQFDGRRPSTSYQTFSESSNSNTDYILPDEPDNVAAISPTLSCGLRTVKVEPDVSANSRDVIYETNNTFYSGPSILNVTKPVRLTRDKCVQSRVPLVLNIADPKDSPSNEPAQNGVTSHTESSALTQVLDRTDYEESCNNKSTQTEVSTHSSSPLPPRDKFDAFGEFIASKLRNLDPKSSAYVQTAFSELLFKAELGMFLNRNEKSNSSIEIDGIRKDIPLSNESEIAHGPPGKENIQPVVPSLMENSGFSGALSSESSSRNDFPQSEFPHLKPHSSYPPVRNNTGPENAVRNELIQPRVTSYIGNIRPAFVPESPSSNQTRASSHAAPAFLPDLNRASSSSNQLIQPIVPFRGRPRDKFDAYGEFTATKLRNLDPRSCAFVQRAFADLIFEAELGRFLSEGEKSIFTNKTNDILRKMPSANDYRDTQGSVVSNSSMYDARPTKDFVTPAFYESEVPVEIIPSMHSIHK